MYKLCIKWIHKQRDTANNASIEWRYFTYYLYICNAIRFWCCCVKIVFYIFLHLSTYRAEKQNQYIKFNRVKELLTPHLHPHLPSFDTTLCLYYTIIYLLESWVQLFILPIIGSCDSGIWLTNIYYTRHL